MSRENGVNNFRRHSWFGGAIEKCVYSNKNHFDGSPFASSFNRCAHKIHCTWVRELGMCARERKIIEESPEHFGWFRGTKNDAGRRAHGHHSMWSSANWPYFLNQIPNSAFTRMQASQLTDWAQAKKTCGIGAHRHRQNQLRKFN